MTNDYAFRTEQADVTSSTIFAARLRMLQCQYAIAL